MAVIDYEEVQPPAGADMPAGTKLFKWPGTGSTFGSGDTGKPLVCGHYPDKVLHVFATNFNGATVTLEGTNEIGTPTTSVVLRDEGGTAIALTTAALVQVRENPVQLFPRVAGGVPTGLSILLHVATSARR